MHVRSPLQIKFNHLLMIFTSKLYQKLIDNKLKNNLNFFIKKNFKQKLILYVKIHTKKLISLNFT